MKIQPINSMSVYFSAHNSMQKRQNQQRNIMFSGVTPPLNNKLNLSDKLSLLFKDFKSGDVIAIGKSVQEIQEGLSKCVKELDNMVKRLIFVKDSQLSTPFVFTKDEHNMPQITNIGNNEMSILGMDGTSAIEPGNSVYYIPEDIIFNGNNEIEILGCSKIPTKIDKLDTKSFSTVYDYDSIQNERIKKFNEDIIKGLTKEKTIEPPKNNKITFNDIGGLEKVIDQLYENVIAPIECPSAFEDMGLKMEHGIVLSGPPGCGKSLVAQAIANETNAYYEKLNGLELESKWVGESEHNWRALINRAIEHGRSIIFIDEFDGVAKKRGGQDQFGDKIVNQILTLMDDIEKNNHQVYVIVATNRPEILDSAISRSGRFGYHIEIPLPDKEGIKQIFEIHSRKRPLAKDLDKEYWHDKLLKDKRNGADIALLLNQAQVSAYRRLGIFEKIRNKSINKKDLSSIEINHSDFENAYKVIENRKNKMQINPIGYNK